MKKYVKESLWQKGPQKCQIKQKQFEAKRATILENLNKRQFVT